MRFHVYLLIIVMLCCIDNAHSNEPSPKARRITLAEAVTRAVAQNPSLAAMGHRVDADAARLQGREGVPNPALSVDIEDIAGSGAAKGVEAMQVTTALSQDIPLGGRVGALRRLNQTRQSVSAMDRQIAEQSLIADVALAYLRVLTEQRRLANAEEMMSLADETVQSISFQVEAGRATEIEVDKAAVVLSLAKLDKARIRRELTIAKQRLATECGDREPIFDIAVGTLDHIAPLPDREALLDRIDRHPSLLSRTAKLRYEQAILNLEKANRVPDLSVSLGYRWLNASKDSALVAAVSVPLPFADRNVGNIGAATHEVRRAEKEGEQERNLLFRFIAASYERLAAQHERATVLTKEVYPKVLATYQAIAEGYRIGRFGYLDLLDAQRTLFEVKEQTLEALVAYHDMAILLNRTAALTIKATTFDPLSSAKKGVIR